MRKQLRVDSGLAEKIARRAIQLTASFSHGTAVKIACQEFDADTPEMRSIVSTMVTNFEINGHFSRGTHNPSLFETIVLKRQGQRRRLAAQGGNFR